MNIIIALLLLFSFISILLYYFILKYPTRGIFVSYRPDLKELPGGIPLFGNLFQLIDQSQRLHEHHLANNRELGPGWTSTMPMRRIIDVSKPEWLEHVQKTNFDNYRKGHIFTKASSDFWGIGIFNSDGDSWYYQRKIISHLFTVSRFKTVITSAIEISMNSFLVILDDLASTNSDYMISDAFYRFTLEAFNRMAFGAELGLLERDDVNKVVPFAVAFDEAHTQLNRRFVNPLLEKFTERWSEAGSRMKRNLEIVDEYAYGLIDSRIKERTMWDDEDDKVKVKEEKDLLDMFLDMTHEDGSKLKTKEVRDMVLNLIIAGRDSTAATLNWIFFRLIRNFKYIEWLREEIRKVKSNRPGEGLITFENWKEFVRAHAIFSETLRLHPSVPGHVEQHRIPDRVALKDDQIPNGPKIQAGNIIRWSDWVMARDSNIWGSDATEFKPERWIDDEGNFKNVSQWKFHSFNGGPRLCLGQNLATYEAIYIFVNLFWKYDFEFSKGWWEGCEKIRGIRDVFEDAPLYQRTIVPGIKGGLKVKISKREFVDV